MAEIKKRLGNYEMQSAISLIKQTFQQKLGEALNLKRVSAPLFVASDSGLNDDLNGTERPVSFDIPAIGKDAVVVHSLAKWKRLALKKYGFAVHEGLYTDMNAIRRDEETDPIHSIYVDQWDWEKIITDSDRTVEYLKETVRAIVKAICDTNKLVSEKFPSAAVMLSDDVSFVSSQELEDMYPDLTPKEREHAYLKKTGTAFIMKIGGKLTSGKPHDSRAPDYDDWELNGDLLFWDDVLGRSLEISSMGIRVNEESLTKQLEIAGCTERKNLPFHKMLLDGKLPLTIGGGIGQSRLCMLMLGCTHVGEVQCSLWDEATLDWAEKEGITIL